MLLTIVREPWAERYLWITSAFVENGRQLLLSALAGSTLDEQGRAANLRESKRINPLPLKNSRVFALIRG
jgi:hypothetical protein